MIEAHPTVDMRSSSFGQFPSSGGAPFGSGAPSFSLAPRQHAPPPPGLGGPHSHAPPPDGSMGRGNNGRTLGPPQGARSFGQPPAGRGRESPRDDYPRLNVGGSTSGLSRSRSEEPPKRTAPPTRFDKDFPTLGPTGVGGSGGPMQGMGRGSQNRVPAQQQQQPQPKPKLVQKSLAPYNPRMAQSGLGRSSGTATGWNNNGAAVAAGTVAAVAVTPAVPLATEPAAAATTTARAAADAKTAESKATDFNAFLKKGPAPQGMRLPDELSNNAAKKDAGVVAGTAAGSNGQNVPYVRPADRDSAEPNRGADAPSAPLDPAMELIQRNKNQTAKATAQIPFKPDETSQGIRPPQQQPMQQQRGDVKRLPTRHAGAGTRNAASDRNRDRGAKKLGDRLALARGIEMPATRRTAKGSGNGMLAPGAETDAATSDDSSAQLQQSLPQDGHAEEDLHMDMHSQESQSAPPLQQPQPTQDGMSRFDSDASAVNAASAFQDQNADLDFERLMKEMGWNGDGGENDDDEGGLTEEEIKQAKLLTSSQAAATRANGLNNPFAQKPLGSVMSSMAASSLSGESLGPMATATGVTTNLDENDDDSTSDSDDDGY